MADIIACDRCGKQSPDKDGLYIANDWVRVQFAYTGRYKWTNEFIFCEECLPCLDVNYSDGDKVCSRITKILKLTKRILGLTPKVKLLTKEAPNER